MPPTITHQSCSLHFNPEFSAFLYFLIIVMERWQVQKTLDLSPKKSHGLLSGNLGGHSFRIGQCFELQRKKIRPIMGKKVANCVFYNLRKMLTVSSNLINIISCCYASTWHYYFMVFYYQALLNITVGGWNLIIPILDPKCILMIFFLDVLFFSSIWHLWSSYYSLQLQV